MYLLVTINFFLNMMNIKWTVDSELLVQKPANKLHINNTWLSFYKDIKKLVLQTFYLFTFLICASDNLCVNQLTGIAP